VIAQSDVPATRWDWPHRLAGRAAWRRHCPSGEGARRGALQWRRFGNGLTAALEFHVVRALISTVTLASTRSEHGIPGPRRRQARSPAAEFPITPGCHPDEWLSSRPRGAGWNEAVRGPGVPRAAEGAVELRTPAVQMRCSAHRLLRPRTGPRRLAGRAAWRRHCPSGEGARHRACQWRRFGNGLTAALGFGCVRADCGRPVQRPCDAPLPVPFSVFSGSR
jgi:hypothetical protein